MSTGNTKIKAVNVGLRQRSSPAFFMVDRNCNGLANDHKDALGHCQVHCPTKEGDHHHGKKGHLLARQKSFDYYMHPTERNSLIQLRGEVSSTFLEPQQQKAQQPPSHLELKSIEENAAEKEEEDPMLVVEGEEGNPQPGKTTTTHRRMPHFMALLQFWKAWIIIVVPLVSLPLLFGGRNDEEQQAFRCAYVMILMAAFWVTEALPLAITSLLPVAILPLLGIMTTDAVGREYLKETNMMFISGIIVAIAVEHCNLHQRVALKVLLLIGTSPRRLMLGFMLPTAFLSMWISNTATTAMMVPIVDAVLLELERDEIAGSNDKKKMSNIRHMIFLSIAYAANTGGTGTLTGTGSNLILKSALDEYGANNPINFASWMQYAMVPMLINFFFGWIWLQLMYLGLPKCKKAGQSNITKTQQSNSPVSAVIRRQLDSLGPMTFHEGSVLVLFILLINLWFFRQPRFITGWGDFFFTKEVDYIKEDANCGGANCTYIRVVNSEAEAADDATAGMVIVLLLFILPAKLSFWPFVKVGDSVPSEGLLTWKKINDKMPWSLVLLLGGGFALAKATKVSGLSLMMGQQLEVLGSLPDWLILCIVVVMTAAATEVTSNVATCSILLPVLKNLSRSLRIHPVYFLLPVTLSCSYAFMLPVATPPNAIVYSASGMGTAEMMKLGLGMNFICVVVNLAWVHMFGDYMFGLSSFPAWAS